MGGQACINSPGSPASTSKADVLMDHGLQAQRPLMGQHHVQAWTELLPGPPDRALVFQAQDKVAA